MSNRLVRFLFVACLLLLVLTAGSFWWCSVQTKKLVLQQNVQQNRMKGRWLVNQTLVTLHWEKLESNESLQPLVSKMTENFRKEAFRCNFIMSDSNGTPIKKEYLTAVEVNKQGDELSSAPVSGTREMPTLNLNTDDREVLELLMKSDAEQAPDADAPPFAERLSADRNQYHYYQPIYADAPVCITCHNVLGDVPLGSPTDKANSGKGGPTENASLKEGDLMAVVEVTFPDAAQHPSKPVTP